MMWHKSWKATLIVVVVMGLMLGCAGSAVDAGGGAGAPQAMVVTASGSGESALAHTISVTGIGTATARPDVAYLTLGVDVMDKDVAEAISASTARMTAVRAALDAFEIAPADLQTVQYNVWIEQVYNERGEPTGEFRYHVVNQLRIRLREIDRAGALLTAALDAGANSVGGISFAVEDTTALEGAARDLAIANAQARAEQLAAGFGATIKGLNQVAELAAGPGPVARMVAEGIGGGGGQVPVEAGEFGVTVMLSVVFDIE